MPRNLVAGITMQFDAPSLVRIWKIAQFPAILTAFAEEAMTETTDLLAATAVALVPHPGNDQSGRSTGVLQVTINPYLVTPWYGEVSTGDLPYAQRVEYGFTDMTDSLGRYYSYWPDALYFTQSIEMDLDDIANFWSDALDAATLEMTL